MKLYLCFHNSCEIRNLFSWAHIRNCLLLVLLQIAYYILLMKSLKKTRYGLDYLVQEFVHWTLKLPSFLMVSVLNLLLCVRLHPR